ncbi:dihydrofolate reductase [uncultured Mucilaginibacter sp.]|uniref:dihydrofolate reductase n=1 Tax=uncultured Mucilaginibacter sp. TaxID=797541 RepID=UPI00262289F5|nr:dihydrofolate reductase [uncultured Mucilaginibacter sp.]
MLISLVVAVAANNAIGKNNKLLWHLPADLKHFKQITTGHTVFMGRKTYQSIGKPLPNRRNIVISKIVKEIAGCEVVPSMEEALLLADKNEEAMVIGGAEIYKLALPKANRIYLTKVHYEFEADTFFPEIDPNQWQETQREDFPADEKNPFPYSYITLNRL